MSGVTISAAMRSNLLSLQATTKLMGETQFRLASGNKVNSALDNPSSFFAAQSLNSRADDLSSLLDGMGQSVQAIKAAAQGITGLTTLIKQAKSIADTARSQVTNAAVLKSTVDLTAGNQADIGVFINAAGGDFNIQLGSGPVSNIGIAAGDTLTDVVAKINLVAGVSAVTVAGTGANTLNIQITGTDNITITDGTNTAAASLGIAVGTANAVSQVPVDRISLETQFTEIRNQIDTFITDTSFAGKNLLNGDTLSTQFNEKNTSNQSLVGKKLDSAGLGLVAPTFDTTTNIEASLTNITNALSTLRSEGRRFGNALAVIQTRSDFTNNLTATLRDGASQLTIADKNTEGANLLALQTSQQLGIQALSLASQSNQSVLRLFR